MSSITTDQARGITARGEGGAVLISVNFITLRKLYLNAAKKSNKNGSSVNPITGGRPHSILELQTSQSREWRRPKMRNRRNVLWKVSFAIVLGAGLAAVVANAMTLLH